MIERLEAGYNPIDVSIEKWVGIKNGKGGQISFRTCALCYKYPDECDECPLYKIGEKCEEEGSAYGKYFHNNKPKNAQLMINALKKAKKWQEEQNCNDEIEKEEPEVFYKVGDRFEYEPDDETYILGRLHIPNKNKMCYGLIGLDGGNMWSDSAFVKDSDKITQAEFEIMAGYESKHFTKVSK